MTRSSHGRAKTRHVTADRSHDRQDARSRRGAKFNSVVSAFVQEPDVGMIVTPSPLTNTAENRGLIFALAGRLRLPTIYPYRLTPSSSGLISYSYDQVAQWQGGASYVDRVLRGAKPADLPVQ